MRYRLLIISGLILLFLCLLGAFFYTPPTRAAGLPADVHPAGVILVGTYEDIITGSVCSLRAAIIAANWDSAYGGCAAGSGDDVIFVPAGVYTLTIINPTVAPEFSSLTGDLNITSTLALTVTGAGNAVIQGGPGWNDRILQVSMSSTVTASNVTIQGGMHPAGAGLRNNGVLSLTNSLIISNTAPAFGFGGGIYNAGTLTLNKCAIVSNTATIIGGGLYNESGAVLATLNNVTLSGNASGGDGGGIYNESRLGLNNSTVINNSAVISGSGIFAANSIDVKNSILAGNANNKDCQGYLNSQGYNLIQNTTECNLGGYLVGVITGSAAQLGPLQDNGGATLTHALLVGSPALDSGSPTQCEAVDQRGISRPQGSKCDMGAFELQWGDLTIAHSVIPASADLGGPLTYTILITDASLLTATGVVVTDVLPAGVSGISVLQPGSGCGTVGAIVTCTLGALAPQTGALVTIRVNAPLLNGVFTSTVSVTGNEPENLANNTASVAVKIGVHNIYLPLVRR